MKNANIDFSQISKQFQNLDINNIGNWPPLAKSAAILFICGLVMFGLYYATTSTELEVLDAARARELTLRSEFETKAAKASNLSTFTQQMQQMQEAFKDLLRQLPKTSEVPSIVDEISYAGSGAGLQFNKLELQAEQRKEFIVEAPIAVSVNGSYHQLGEFVSKVSALPRIVTLHDFVIKSNGKDVESADNLTMEIIAKTYRYESAEEKAGGAK